MATRGARMDSEAATENEWSESEHEWSETEDDVREARVHVAAQRSDTETMRDELEAGENPNVRNYDGSTPLYLVCLFADVVRFRQFSTNHDARKNKNPRRQRVEHGRIGDADGPRAERLDCAEGAEERVVDLARVVGAHGGGRFLLWRTRGRGWITLAATLRLTQG